MTLRVSAAVTLALLAGFYLLRATAPSCAGAACEAYIPLSLLVPAAVLASAAVTAVLALVASRRDHAWFSVLALAASAGIFGPLLAVGLLRDQPDRLVPLASLLFVLVPAGALAYSFSRR